MNGRNVRTAAEAAEAVLSYLEDILPRASRPILASLLIRLGRTPLCLLSFRHYLVCKAPLNVNVFVYLINEPIRYQYYFQFKMRKLMVKMMKKYFQEHSGDM